MNPMMDALMARAGAQLERMYEMQESLAAIVVREQSSNALVTVEVDAHGEMRTLELAPGANELGPQALGELIVATAGSAADKAFAQRALLTEDFTESFAEMLADRRDAELSGSASLGLDHQNPSGTGGPSYRKEQ